MVTQDDAERRGTALDGFHLEYRGGLRDTRAIQSELGEQRGPLGPHSLQELHGGAGVEVGGSEQHEDAVQMPDEHRRADALEAVDGIDRRPTGSKLIGQRPATAIRVVTVTSEGSPTTVPAKHLGGDVKGLLRIRLMSRRSIHNGRSREARQRRCRTWRPLLEYTRC